MAADARLTIAVSAAALLAGSALASPVSDLPGRWSGFGHLKMSSGESEQMRCVVTYFVEGPIIRHAVKQNLRCASAGGRIDATANLVIADGEVSGDWEERVWSTTGSVSGRMVDNGYRLTISGPGFTAALALSTTGCKQSIDITPRGTPIESISMSLGKC